MPDLWNPSSQEKAALARGDRKLALSRMKNRGIINETQCHHCGKDVFIDINDRAFLKNGSRHNCIGMNNI